ncbi:MAG: hypothetical protein LIP02_10885 [Bacteroidales bacterium]|nr:hypothetical protein [Bacteroidales bacterium]
MKLSDVNGPRSADVMADVLSFMCIFIEDEKLSTALESKKSAAEQVRALYPRLFKNHKKELYEVLGSIEGCSATEYAASATPARVFNDTISLLQDPTFRDLFPSPAPTTATTSERGLENTEVEGAAPQSSTT